MTDISTTFQACLDYAKEGKITESLQKFKDFLDNITPDFFDHLNTSTEQSKGFLSSIFVGHEREQKLRQLGKHLKDSNSIEVFLKEIDTRYKKSFETLDDLKKNEALYYIKLNVAHGAEYNFNNIMNAAWNEHPESFYILQIIQQYYSDKGEMEKAIEVLRHQREELNRALKLRTEILKKSSEITIEIQSIISKSYIVPKFTELDEKIKKTEKLLEETTGHALESKTTLEVVKKSISEHDEKIKSYETRSIELLGIFASVITFVLVTVQILKEATLPNAIILMTGMANILLIFAVTVSLLFGKSSWPKWLILIGLTASFMAILIKYNVL